MMKHTYRSVEVQLFDVAGLLRDLAPSSELVVAIDVAKNKMMAAIANAQGQILQMVKWQQPQQTSAFVAMVVALQTSGRKVEAVMEPTGTYGDPLRYQLQQRQIPVFLASSHFVRNMGLVYDGVPSKHDAKDAAVIARLHCQGSTKLWPVLDETRRTLRALVDEREIYSTPMRRTANQLEAVLSRHFPELLGILDIQQQRTAWALLIAFPSAAAMAASPQQVKELLRTVSRGRFSTLLIERVVAAAATTSGAIMSTGESRLVQRMASEMQRCVTQCDVVDAELTVLTAQPQWEPLRKLLGSVTLAVVVAYVGDPANYSSSAAFVKACGLNLREHSSGTKQGKLSLTKRGPSIVRKYLHLAGLRLIQRSSQMKHWYQHRRQFLAGNKMSAIVAVVRKLAAALVHVARGTAFDINKLVDTRGFPTLIAVEPAAPLLQPLAPANEFGTENIDGLQPLA
jgi:transposase